ncbi:DUF2280 domain-containing protein [Burkholderia cenocepacia]|uniref:DUF2280 domain-containing protein n=1 Tax=Burkholderia cenocepacia TaxID=95486 RepID=UPI0022371B87|nr:DUF2280 domain-containing protein [Burkholderia cenocepacia]MCW5118611.1 DUF2280 domain-containing protein [Burkholderia cenocepacia]MCW5130922.1 DUF2280 domain-containing protein [Burkholderia cenocepacia]MCW5174046.1 DUF2280 domain-containing protein [Burkholderia cenocepacia]
MAALPENVKARIVQGLACFDTPSQVAKDVYAEFGLAVTPQHCESYDPTKAAGAKVGKKRRAEFEAIRSAFLADLGQSAMSHRAVRLRRLERLMTRAENSGNIVLTAQLIEQISRECEGAELADLQRRLAALGGNR